MQNPINEIKDHSVKKIYLKKPHAEFFCVHLTAEVNTCTCNKKTNYVQLRCRNLYRYSNSNTLNKVSMNHTKYTKQ